MKLMRVKSPEEVLGLINDSFKTLEPETVTLLELGGRTVAKTIYAPEDIPGFDRSTVDGYAVAARSTFGSGEGIPAILESVGEGLMGKTSSPD
jgi:molybdopterin molybdotransferase